MNKVKVCLISRSAYSLFNPDCKATFGGAEVDLYILANALIEDGNFSVDFLVGDFGQEKTEYKNGVKLIRGYRLSELKIIQMLKLVINIILSHSDVYIQESASGGTGIIALTCHFMGRKFIYRAASIIDSNGEFVKNNKIEGFLFSLGLRLANAIIVQTEVQQLQLKATSGLKSNVIKNAIKLPDIFTNSRVFCLWIGRSEELKQPELFLDLAEKLPQYQFVMICPHANFNSVDMNALSQRALQYPNVKLINSVPFLDINNYYKKATIFINTSKYEGFPNTFVQATAHGVPIISLNVNPDNFLEVYKCGVCANGNFSSLIDSVQRIASDPTVRDELGKNAFRYALENHDITQIVLKYKDIIRKIRNV